MNKKIKVLICDDSALVRKILTEELSHSSDIEIVGTAPDPYIARDKIVQLEPNVLILDIEMPKMDGLTFLEILMRHHPMPVIILSSLAKEGGTVALKALDLGASEVLAKPGSSYSIKDMGEQLIFKIKAVCNIRNFKKSINGLEGYAKTTSSNAMLKTTQKIIAIGASTGGTEAIKDVLIRLPIEIPPILIVQHMPENFTKSFANRLNSLCAVTVKEAENGESASFGKVLIAPGNKHMELRRNGANYFVELSEGPLVHHQRPSVEVLFSSVAKYAAQNSIGVILTGMGKDGAKGMLDMKNAGAYTIAQDEKSCIVFGMPREAIALGGVDKILPLDRIAQGIVDAI